MSNNYYSSGTEIEKELKKAEKINKRVAKELGEFNLSEKIWSGTTKGNVIFVGDVKEFIKRREERLRNQIRIHWNWLKDKSQKEVSEFIVKIANAEVGDDLI